MQERFTDRARKVMQLAKQEAERFCHEYIGTEHILLGLIREGSGVAANVFKNLGISLARIRLEIEQIVLSGPDMVTMGKLPQTPRAKKVIEYAVEEARKLNHNYVGTEHLLLGLIREEEGVAGQVLMNLGLSLQVLRDEVMNILGAAPDAAIRREETPSPENDDSPELSDISSDEMALLPLQVRQALRMIECLMDSLIAMKQEGVAQQHFERAAHLRDHVDRLGNLKDWLLREWHREL
jgi:ATP-dependent Clp protease ATP-binding subunit ClpA